MQTVIKTAFLTRAIVPKRRHKVWLIAEKKRRIEERTELNVFIMELQYRGKPREVKLSMSRDKKKFIILLVTKVKAAANNYNFATVYRITKEPRGARKSFDGGR